MTRIVHLAPHLSAAELAQRHRHAPDVVEARRWHLLRLVASAHTIKDAAATVGLNYDYARAVVRRYSQQGPDALRNRSHEKQPPTPRCLLTPEQQAELRAALADPAPDGGMWSGPKVARWIAQRTGQAQVYPQRGWVYLRRFGHSPHVPRPRHERADPAAQAAFKQTSRHS